MGSRRQSLASSEDNLRAYFAQIKKTRLLTYEEEQALSKRIQRGDEEARRELIEANLRLVVRIAKNYLTPEVSLMDLIQEGNMGLMKAASKFDHRKGVRFSTYASWWIKQSIIRSLSNKRRTIRLPHRQEEKLRKVNKIYNQLSQKLKREPTVMEIATDLGIGETELSSILSSSTTVVSLDGSSGEEAGALYEMVEDNAYNPDRELIRKSMRDDTLRFLNSLLDKERQILLYRFSFVGGRKYTLKKIGDELGISPETVRQIELRAIRKLKSFTDELKEYMYN